MSNIQRYKPSLGWLVPSLAYTPALLPNRLTNVSHKHGSRPCTGHEHGSRTHTGMEITFSYRGDMMLPAEERREELLRQWGFECACEACRGVAEGVAEYDMWVEYEKLDKMVDRFVRKRNYDEALATLKRQLDLCRCVGLFGARVRAG